MSPSPEPPLASSSSAPGTAHPQIPLEGPSQSTAPGAQRPTLTNTHIRSVADAQKLFYAVQRGLLPKVERRLDAVERKRLRPGDVYVWEERGASGLFAGAPGGGAVVTKEGMAGPAEAAGYEVGIERWTEGLSWSASRIRDEFLIYFENVKKKERGVDREGHRARSLENQVLREGDRDMYIKQTYSVLRLDVSQEESSSGPSGSAVLDVTPGTSASGSGDKKDVKKKPRKWHLNAYFTKSTEGNLNTIDTIPWLRDLVVPDGIFTSARQSKKTSGAGAASSSAGPTSASTSQTKLETPDDTSSLGKRSRAPPAVQRTYAAFPTGDRRPHPRPVVPAPPPPPPPLPPGSASGNAFGTHAAPPQPPSHLVAAEDMEDARSNAADVPGAMHVLVPGRSGHSVQTVPLEPIDTTAARLVPGDPTSPPSAGVHGSTVGLYRMHIGEGGEPLRAETPVHPQTFGSPQAFGASTFGDIANAGQQYSARDAFDFQQQQQLRELQRFQERQQAQHREQQQRLQEQQQHQQFYGAGGFDFDAGQAFQHPHGSMQPPTPTHTHPQHHLQAHAPAHSHSSPHAYSPLQTILQGPHVQHPHSPIHGPLSPALSDFRASSEFSHSSSSSSSRGGSVSSGSGSVRLLHGGAWSPQPDPSQFDFPAYHIKSEYSELGMALGTAAGPGVPSQGADGMYGGGDSGEGETDEDLSGYLPMPALPAALTEPAEASAGRRRAAARRAAADSARGREQRVDVARMSGLAIRSFEGLEGAGDLFGMGIHGGGPGSDLPQSSSSSLVDALSMSAPSSWSTAMSPPLSAVPRALSPRIALPSVPSVPSTPLSVPSVPSVPAVPPQPITMPSIPLVTSGLSTSLPKKPSLEALATEGAGKERTRVLAPLHQLQRAHPYRNRNRHEERALRMLRPVSAPGAK